MKIRTDFVTNSSSSFIIARRGELTKEQKGVIIDYVESHMLGDKVASTKEGLMHYFKEERGWDDKDFDDPDQYYHKNYIEALSKIEKGFSIYSGTISFEGEDEIAYLLNGLWDKLSDHSSHDFVEIDTSLEY